MTYAGHTAICSEGQTQTMDEDDLFETSAEGVELCEAKCTSGSSSQPRRSVTEVFVSSSPTGPSSETSDDGASAGWARSGSPSRPNEMPRCERHNDRSADMYCRTCLVPICVVCATSRHSQTSGHDPLDIADIVDHCRTMLVQHVTKLNNRQMSYLGRIETTNAIIESIRSESISVLLSRTDSSMTETS